MRLRTSAPKVGSQLDLVKNQTFLQAHEAAGVRPVPERRKSIPLIMLDFNDLWVWWGWISRYVHAC